MSFLGLPREIRDQIYHETLCPPQGIILNYINMGQLERKLAQQKNNSKSPDVDEENEELSLENGDYPFRTATADPPIHNSLLFDNRQTSEEALQILYCHNRFTFNVTPKEVTKFFNSSDPLAKELITNIGFGIGSTFAFDDGVREGWKPLCSFISRHLHIHTASILIPSDEDHITDNSKEIQRAPDAKGFWEPAVRDLFKLLLGGNIQKLRLCYCETYVKYEHQQGMVDCSREFKMTRMLLYRYQERSGSKFITKWEDGLTSDVGTVLTVTRVSDA